MLLTGFGTQVVGPVSAHDTIPNGTTSEATVTAQVLIQHSCDPSLDANGNPTFPRVIAYSFIFPTVDPIATRDDNGEAVDINEVVVNFGPQIVTPFWDKRIFKDHQLKTDSLGNNIGFSSTGGNFPQGFMGEVPIMISPMFFWYESCATQVTVKPVGADICKISETPVSGDANIWMDHPTAKFPNPLHGVGENAMRLVFLRDLNSHPLPASCHGEGFSVTVTASDKDIDANLPIPGYWPGKVKSEDLPHKGKRRH